jgi:hypothetical protein
MTDKTDYAPVFLCEDCTHAAHGSLIEWETDAVPLAKFGETVDLTADYCSDHYVTETKPCENCDGHYGENDDDGYHTFATFACDGCESGLAGARFRFALWV